MTNKDSLKTKISKWLHQQGYPLEMWVASTVQKVGFRTVQSEYFRDPETGDPREVDVLAALQEQFPDVLFRISLLIECKLSSDKPWLLFTSKRIRLAGPARVAQRAANQLGRMYLDRVARQKDVQSIPIFSLPERPAYGVTQAFTTGRDVCHSAVTSVSKAAFSMVARLDEAKEMRQKNLRFRLRYPNIISIILPVVVVDGQLFEVYLDDQMDTVVNEINSGTLLWRNPIVGMPHTIIRIISSAKFEKFAAESLKSIKKLIVLSGGVHYKAIENAIAREKRGL